MKWIIRIIVFLLSFWISLQIFDENSELRKFLRGDPTNKVGNESSSSNYPQTYDSNDNNGNSYSSKYSKSILYDGDVYTFTNEDDYERFIELIDYLNACIENKNDIESLSYRYSNVRYEIDRVRNDMYYDDDISTYSLTSEISSLVSDISFISPVVAISSAIYSAESYARDAESCANDISDKDDTYSLDRCADYISSSESYCSFAVDELYNVIKDIETEMRYIIDKQ